MITNPPTGRPRITPALYYENPAEALSWLENAFGFQKDFVVPDENGDIMHSEMTFMDTRFMVGPTTWADIPASPKTNQGHNTQSLYVYVDDVDAHFEHAKNAGATILAEPEDQFYGDRTYRTIDCEGHMWTFGQHVKDVEM